MCSNDGPVVLLRVFWDMNLCSLVHLFYSEDAEAEDSLKHYDHSNHKDYSLLGYHTVFIQQTTVQKPQVMQLSARLHGMTSHSTVNLVLVY